MQLTKQYKTDQCTLKFKEIEFKVILVLSFIHKSFNCQILSNCRTIETFQFHFIIVFSNTNNSV